MDLTAKLVKNPFHCKEENLYNNMIVPHSKCLLI